MLRILAALATVALTLTALGTPARASHATVFIYSPDTSKTWVFTSLAGPDHPAGYLSTAQDVAGADWTGSDNVTFNASTSGTTLQGYVENAGVNCPNGGPDNYVKLQLWSDGEYFGKVAYVHLRTVSVTVGSWINPGTTLGAIQNTASNNGYNCWTGVHVHMETLSGNWLGVGTQVTEQYSQWVLYYPTGLLPLLSPTQDARRLTDHRPHKPVR